MRDKEKTEQDRLLARSLDAGIDWMQRAKTAEATVVSQRSTIAILRGGVRRASARDIGIDLAIATFQRSWEGSAAEGVVGWRSVLFEQDAKVELMDAVNTLLVSLYEAGK